MHQLLFYFSLIGIVISLLTNWLTVIGFYFDFYNSIFLDALLVIVWLPSIPIQIKRHQSYGKIEPEPKGMLNQMSIYWGGTPKGVALLLLIVFFWGTCVAGLSFFVEKRFGVIQAAYLFKSGFVIGLWALALGMNWWPKEELFFLQEKKKPSS